MRAIDFIGLGGGRSGTNWLSACLYEHPELCVRPGEVHFFSRERNWSRGYEWYESLLAQCPTAKKTGEFSSSYLVDPATPQRIHTRYPHTKLIVSLRNPIDRAISDYRNELTGGAIPPTMLFHEAAAIREQYIGGGRHATNIGRYLDVFSREQILILIFEEVFQNPERAVKTIFEFLGVDSSFKPRFLHTTVNAGMIPRFRFLHRLFTRGSSFLLGPGSGIGRSIWWFIKKLGITDVIKRFNTSGTEVNSELFTEEDRRCLENIFRLEIERTEKLIGRRIEAWHR